MASPVTPPTLAITGGDTINYKGAEYVVSSVAAGVNDGLGTISYAVTLTGGTVITCSANDTILSHEIQNGTQYWAQTANA